MTKLKGDDRVTRVMEYMVHNLDRSDLFGVARLIYELALVGWCEPPREVNSEVELIAGAAASEANQTPEAVDAGLYWAKLPEAATWHAIVEVRGEAPYMSKHLVLRNLNGEEARPVTTSNLLLGARLSPPDFASNPVPASLGRR